MIIICDALGLPKTGTVGVLLAATNAGFIDFDDAIARLQATRFRLHPELVITLRHKLKSRQS